MKNSGKQDYFQEFCNQFSTIQEFWEEAHEPFCLSLKPSYNSDIKTCRSAIEKAALLLDESPFGLLEIWRFDEMWEQESLDSLLEKHGIYLNAVFESAEAAWLPCKLRSVYLVMSRLDNSLQFFGSLDPTEDIENFNTIYKLCRYLMAPSDSSTDIEIWRYESKNEIIKSFSGGEFFTKGSFRGFSYTYKHAWLHNNIVQFAKENQDFKPLHLSDFKPLIELSPPEPDSENLEQLDPEFHHSNEIEIYLSEGFHTFVTPQDCIYPDGDAEITGSYICEFLKSNLGRAIMEMKRADFKQLLNQTIFSGRDAVDDQGNYRRNLDALEAFAKPLIEDILIFLPKPTTQRKVVENVRKLEKVRDSLNSIERHIYSNSNKEQDELLIKLDGFYVETIKLTDEGKIKSLLGREEGKTLEYKASLRVPYPDYPEPKISKDGVQVWQLGKQTFTSKKQIHAFLEDIVLKAIASLLNTDGGELVIGVHEKDNEKEIVGIEMDGFPSSDQFERHLAGLISNNFGTDIATRNVTTMMLHENGKSLCVVVCEPNNRSEPVYFKDKLFVRTGPRVEELIGKEQARYILNRKEKNSPS